MPKPTKIDGSAGEDESTPSMWSDETVRAETPDKMDPDSEFMLDAPLDDMPETLPANTTKTSAAMTPSEIAERREKVRKAREMATLAHIKDDLPTAGTMLEEKLSQRGSSNSSPTRSRSSTPPPSSDISSSIGINEANDNRSDSHAVSPASTDRSNITIPAPASASVAAEQSFWQRNRRKILFGVVGALAVTAIVVASVMTAGLLPAIAAGIAGVVGASIAVGAALGMGLMATAGSFAGAVLGVVAEEVISRKFNASSATPKIEQSHVKILSGKPPLKPSVSDLVSSNQNNGSAPEQKTRSAGLISAITDLFPRKKPSSDVSNSSRSSHENDTSPKPKK